MNDYPWYKSTILIGQLATMLTALAAVVGISFDFDIQETLTAVFGGVAAAVSIYTFVRRLLWPSPNLTATATAKEAVMVAEGKIPVALASSSVVNK